MTERKYHSLRTGSNPNKDGCGLADLKDYFQRLYDDLSDRRYFAENLGFHCIEDGLFIGKVSDVDKEIFLKIRKRDLWPIKEHINDYEEDDLFDMIEFLHTHVSKPTRTEVHHRHHYENECIHGKKFDQKEGQNEFREKINELLEVYQGEYELSRSGEIVSKPDLG